MAYKFQVGNATMSGSLTQEEGITTTTLSATGDVDLGNQTSDTITCTGQFDSDLIPSTDSARDLGTSAKQWAEAHVDTGHIDTLTVTGTSTLTTVDINGGNIDGTVIGAASVAAGSFAAVVGTTGTYSGILKTDDTTEATSTTDGSLQTDGGLSVAKSAVIGDDLDLLSDSAIINVGSTSKFTLTDQAANNCLMATANHRLAFGNAGEYISGDGTDLKIVSSNDIDVTGDLDVAGMVTSTLGSTLASASGTVTMGAATPVTVSAAGVLDVASTVAASAIGTAALVVDGGASVAADLLVGDDVTLLSDSAVLGFGGDTDTTLTHVADTALQLNSTRQLRFNDWSANISSSAANYLDLFANTQINLSGAVNLNSSMVVAGATTLKGAVTLGDATSDDITIDGRIVGGLVPKTDNLYPLGTTALEWSDLFLGSGGVINFDNGDVTLTHTNDVLTIGGSSSPTVTATLTNAFSDAANSGLSGTTYNGSAAVSDWALDLNDLTAATIAVANDSFAFIDSDGNVTRKESIADLATLMAGAGITATNGVFSTDAAATPSSTADGTTLSEGFNYFATDLTGSSGAVVHLPASPDAGDVVYVKAKGGVSATSTITIKRTTGTHTIDGNSEIVIESPYGAVSLSYVVANDWRVF